MSDWPQGAVNVDVDGLIEVARLAQIVVERASGYIAGLPEEIRAVTAHRLAVAMGAVGKEECVKDNKPFDKERSVPGHTDLMVSPESVPDMTDAEASVSNDFGDA